jgi:hypothetical protein
MSNAIMSVLLILLQAAQFFIGKASEPLYRLSIIAFFEHGGCCLKLAFFLHLCNAQAFEWATLNYARRPLSHTRLIPIDLFEGEKPDLIKLPGSAEG